MLFPVGDNKFVQIRTKGYIYHTFSWDDHRTFESSFHETFILEVCRASKSNVPVRPNKTTTGRSHQMKIRRTYAPWTSLLYVLGTFEIDVPFRFSLACDVSTSLGDISSHFCVVTNPHFFTFEKT